jgi:hypothetical protein
VIKQEVQEESFDFDNISGSLICESVCMTEYYNRLTLLENSTDNEERAILESELMVLQELTIKDIGQKILKALMFIWESLKKFAKHIKDFFTRARIKELRKRVKELEEQNLDLNTNLDLEKGKNANLSKENEKLKKNYDDLDKSASFKLKAERDHAEWLDDRRAKEKSEKMQYIHKIDSIMISALSNKYIYFDQYDYIDKNARRFISIIQSDLITSTRDMIKYGNNNAILEYDPDSEEWNDFAKTRKFYILSDKFLDKKKNEILTLHSVGGESSIVRLVEQDLEEKAKEGMKQFEPVKGKEKQFFEFIDKQLEAIEDENYSDLSFQLGKAAEGAAKIAKEFINKSNEYKVTKKDTKTGIEYASKEQPEEYNKTYKSAQYFNKIVKCLRANSTYLTGVCTVMGKAVGALGAAVDSCSIAFGLERIANKRED